MAKNTSNKRIPVKWIRDKAKAAYEKRDNCYICNTSNDLELHHTHSITLLLEKWVSIKGYDVSTDEGILAVRDEFIKDHRKEIYDDVYTLCNKHHVALHGVYGKAPALSTATKQCNWIEKQRAKYTGEEVAELSTEIVLASNLTFSKFYTEVDTTKFKSATLDSVFSRFY